MKGKREKWPIYTKLLQPSIKEGFSSNKGGIEKWREAVVMVVVVVVARPGAVRILLLARLL